MFCLTLWLVVKWWTQLTGDEGSYQPKFMKCQINRDSSSRTNYQIICLKIGRIRASYLLILKGSMAHRVSRLGYFWNVLATKFSCKNTPRPFWAISTNIPISVVTLVATFWASLDKDGQLFIPSSGHTDGTSNLGAITSRFCCTVSPS